MSPLVNLIDLLILIAALVGLANGYRRGFWLSIAQYVGLLVGVMLGAASARYVLDYLQINNASARPLGAVLVLVIGGSLGSSIGFAVGEPIRRKILRTGIHTSTDSVAGAALSAFAVLLMCWFLGLSFSRGPSVEIAQQIQRSVLLRGLDTIAPRPPPFLASVQQVLAGVQFPPVFAGLEPTLPGALPVPASVDTPGVNHAAQSVVKVASLGCGGIVTGSGFPVGGGYIVTNAHVVSGTSSHTIQKPDGSTMRATVVLFDPERDVAVLYVPGYSVAGLTFGSARRGTEGAVIGYPGGLSEKVVAAVVDGSVAAQGRDIYNQNLVTRQIFVLQASVHPGNSGGPLIDMQGHVLGMVFATSASDPNQAYALTDDEIAPDIRDAEANPTPRDTSHYECAA
ncbi:MAG: MarP family serine protease [Chloroflexi bacterium]|nr:MAG: MarP family serine protease [Chloroflexota bacterium]TMF93709.1 MAG: MarP family serine protease [Chloroflexota bacterium]